MITQLLFKIGFTLPILALVGLAVTTFQPHWIINVLAYQTPDVLYFAETEKKIVALTIDDGPDSVTTPKLLDLLKMHNARATFFMIGSRIAGNEAVISRALAENNEIANHMMHDEPSIQLSAVEFEQRLLESDKLLSRFAKPTWFRPGSGWYNEEMLSILKKHGYKAALGSVYPFDPHIPSSWFAAQNILWNVQPGSVIILHDHDSRGERTLNTLQTVLPELSRRGYQVVTLSELQATQK